MRYTQHSRQRSKLRRHFAYCERRASLCVLCVACGGRTSMALGISIQFILINVLSSAPAREQRPPPSERRQMNGNRYNLAALRRPRWVGRWEKIRAACLFIMFVYTRATSNCETDKSFGCEVVLVLLIDCARSYRSKCIRVLAFEHRLI